MRGFRVAFIATLLFAGLAASPLPVGAQSATCSNPNSTGWRDGYANASDDYFATGLSSYMFTASDQVRDSDQTTGNYNTAQIQQADHLGYASAAGIIRRYNQATFAFANASSPANGYSLGLSSQSFGDGVKLELRLVPTAAAGATNNRVRSKVIYPVGGTSVIAFPAWDTVFDLSYTWLTDWWYGGAKYLTSDVPGVPATHLKVTAMGYYDRSTRANVSYPCVSTYLNPLSDNSKWTQSTSSCTAFDVWTATE